MVRFNYTAEKTGGDVYTGVLEAKDRFELYETVRREGARIISVQEDSSTNIWSIQYWNTKITSVPEHEKIVFARNLGAMLTAGLALSRALSVIERQTRNPRLRATVAEVSSDVRRGTTLHDALGKFPHTFSKLFTAMVRAGEESGGLPNALAVVAEQMDRAYALKKKIKGALMYPSIILIAIFGIGALMMVMVVPTLAQTFAELNATLPASTQLIISISNFLVQNTVLALSLFVVAVGGFVGALKTDLGGRVSDFVFVHTPIIGGIVREVNSARTARTLGSLLSAGVDMLTSLEITREVVQNSLFSAILLEAQRNVQKGEQLSHTFARHEQLFPPLVGEMIAVGEETGQLTEMLGRLAGFYEEEVDRKTKDMSTIIEPFLMVFIGGAVGFFAVAMVSPIYQMSNNL